MAPEDRAALRQFATRRQAEFLDAWDQNGTSRKAAKACGVSRGTFGNAMKALKKRAALQGWSPDHDMVQTVPDPFVLRGTSTLYGAAGEQKLQWVKTQLDRAKARDAIEEYVRWLVEDARGASEAVPAPLVGETELATVYAMGDPHFGMYSWAMESGEDFDLNIAERVTKQAVDRLVDSGPDSETAVILELGDFFHADDTRSVTPRSGNALDTDTRWAKVMQVGLRTMTYIVYAALRKHKRVVVRIVKGNHDPHSSYALALALDAYFSNDERVDIDLSPAAFWYYQFGKVLLGSTHGDTVKVNELPGIMATDRPREWGDTSFRYFHCGHVHHRHVKEFPGVVVEYHRTLATTDAWHAENGYRSGRDMQSIVYHRDFGEIERHTCNAAMLDQ